MNTGSSSINQTQQSNIINLLKPRTTFIKYKSNGHTYSRVYYLVLSEDSIHYCGSKRKSKYLACMIKEINQIRPGFATVTWRKCLDKGKITYNHVNLAFSILYNTNRESLDLLAETEEIRSRWIEGIQFLINRYQSHMCTCREITDQWIWHVFSLADTNQSKHLSHSEVQHLLNLLNVQLSENDIKRYLNQANIRTRNHEELAHLDKDEFLLLYKYVSQRPELIKIICQ